MTLEDYLKIAQITFYLGTFIIAILTFISAKKGLLNTVNTEYQKKVMERLAELSNELYDEFNGDSPKCWFNRLDNDPIKKMIQIINEEFLRNKVRILQLKKFEGGYPVHSDYDKLINLVNKVKSDPFVPVKIRNIVVDLLENRANVLFNACLESIDHYRKGLANGKYQENIEENYNWIHNRIQDALYKQGCGISQIEEEVHKVRLEIQKYFQKYDPIRR